MIREIIKIDEDKCNGCGLCIPACHEGALQIIDNKAVLLSDLLCDGLGACLGHCPEGALSVEIREAEPYNEEDVIKEMVKKGKNVVIAHLKHLKDHNEMDLLKQGIDFLWKNKETLDFNPAEIVESVFALSPMSKEFKLSGKTQTVATGISNSCPGSKSIQIVRDNGTDAIKTVDQPSALTQWPVQLHLINPAAGFFKKCDLLFAADCVAFSTGNFHNQFLKNKKLIVACPKLDTGHEIYINKIRQLIEIAEVNTITVMRMEVPCCSGLLKLVSIARQSAKSNVPIKEIVVSISGEIISEKWLS